MNGLAKFLVRTAKDKPVDIAQLFYNRIRIHIRIYILCMTIRILKFGKREDKMKYLPYLAFLVFLTIYAIMKYQAVPSQMGQSAYIMTTLILVTLTAVLPYVLGLFASAKIKQGQGFIAAAIIPFVLSAMGLSVYFFVFIQPVAPTMSVTQVLPRAIVPGLFLSALVVFWVFWRRKFITSA